MSYRTTLAAGLLCLSARLATAGELPFDIIQKAYEPLAQKDELLGFPLKIKELSEGTNHVWGGGKILFFRWCKTNATDWLNDRPAYVTQHGDIHLSNMGTYAAAATLGRIAFGLIDYDDTQRLPFQIELLQCVIALRLLADQCNIQLQDAQVKDLIERLVENYKAAINSGKMPGAMLSKDPFVGKLLKRTAKTPYSQEMRKLLDNNDHFMRIVRNDEGHVTELMRPAPAMADPLAEGIAQAIARSPELRRQFRIHEVNDIRKSIKDVALRFHIRGSGSQGLHKYLILMDRPLAKAPHDAILYAKEVIPAAPELAELIRATRARPASDAPRTSRSWPSRCPSSSGGSRSKRRAMY